MKKSTWIIIGLVVVLSVLYVVLREDKVSVGVKRLQLPAFTTDNIERIEVIGKETVYLKKERGRWLVAVGKDGDSRFVSAEETSVNEALEAAAELKHSHYVTNLKEKYAEYGVEGSDAITVKFYTDAGLAWGIILGKNANSAGRYAKLMDSDEVHVVRGAFFRITRAGASDWRNREIVPLKEPELTTFIMDKDTLPYISLEKEGDVWKFDSTQKLPEGFRVDSGALLSLVRSATSLRAQGFVDEGDIRTNPILVIKATTDKETTTVGFYPGPDDKYWVRRSGDPQIYEVGKNAFDRVNKSLDDLRDFKLLSFDKSLVTKLSLRHGKETIVLVKDNQWKIEKPASLPKDFEFDEMAVEDMISLLSALNALRLAKGKDGATNSAWQQSWLVELELNNGKKVHLFASKNKSGNDEHVVKGNIDNDIYVIKSARISSLTGGINAFKKEALDLPPVNENTKGFDSLPPDVKQKLLDAMKNRQ